MIVNDLLRMWEEGAAVAASPVLNRRDEVSQADLGQHATALRIKTHVQTGLGNYARSDGRGRTTTVTVSWNKGCGGEPTITTGLCP